MCFFLSSLSFALAGWVGVGGGGWRGLRGERCHVSAKLGPGWNYEYKVKWEMLPVIISRALHEQLAKNGQPSRLVEVRGRVTPMKCPRNNATV